MWLLATQEHLWQGPWQQQRQQQQQVSRRVMAPRQGHRQQGLPAACSGAGQAQGHQLLAQLPWQQQEVAACTWRLSCTAPCARLHLQAAGIPPCRARLRDCQLQAPRVQQMCPVLRHCHMPAAWVRPMQSRRT
jgi:hypothetical protein